MGVVLTTWCQIDLLAALVAEGEHLEDSATIEVWRRVVDSDSFAAGLVVEVVDCIPWVVVVGAGIGVGVASGLVVAEGDSIGEVASFDPRHRQEAYLLRVAC